MKKLTLSLLATVLSFSSAFAISDEGRPLFGTMSARTNVLVDTNGSPVCVNSRDQDFIFFLDADFVSGSSTLDVKIQESYDNSNWKDVIAFTQVTTSDATEKVSVSLVNFWRCFRAVMDVGAAGTPNYNVAVRMFTSSRR